MGAREGRVAGAIPPDLPRAERLRRILDRDGHECVWCRLPLGPGDRALSVDHVVPRLKGGPAWAENEVAACRPCNRARGHRSPAEWLRERPQANRDAILRALTGLRDAIAQRGGQRRARPYLDGQLRRLTRGSA